MITKEIYSKKIINNSLYGSFGIGSRYNTIKSKKRRNKIIKVFELDLELEDETTGIVFVPYTMSVPVMGSYSGGIEPMPSQHYIRSISMHK